MSRDTCWLVEFPSVETQGPGLGDLSPVRAEVPGSSAREARSYVHIPPLGRRSVCDGMRGPDAVGGSSGDPDISCDPRPSGRRVGGWVVGLTGQPTGIRAVGTRGHYGQLLLDRSGRAGVGLSGGGPGPGPQFGRLPGEPRRCLRPDSRGGRAGPAFAADPRRPRPAPRSEEFRWRRPGGPATGDPADDRPRCRPFRHRDPGGQLHRRGISAGSGPGCPGGGWCSGNSPDRSRCLLAHLRAVSRRRLDHPGQRQQSL